MLHNSIIIIGFLLMLFVVLDLILVDTHVDYAMKTNFLAGNWRILFLLVLTILVYIVVIKRKITTYSNHFMDFITKYKNIIFICTAIILFALQVTISWNIYFYTGWDTRTITSTAISIANGQIPVATDYYSIYPNNLMLTSIYVLIIKFAQFLKMSDPYFALIFIGNLLVNLSGVLIVLSVRKLIPNRKIIFLSGILYILLIGLSPWLVIPYSDAYGMIFPILAFYIYLHIKEGNQHLCIWFLLGVVCLLGYKIKPTIIIVLMAIIIIESLNLLNYNKEKLIRFLFNMMMICFAAILVTCASGISKSIVNLPIDKERSLTYVHYLMMGLNEEGTGGYYKKDVKLSKSIHNKNEREEAELKVIKKRLKNYGVIGYAKFISKKTLFIYNDGTFAWGKEGAFYNVMLEPKNDTISPFLRNIYYEEGKYFSIYRLITQSVWILVLVLYLGCIFSLKGERKLAVEIIILSIIGITLFLLLFEARGRYLYCYSPFFVVGAMIGLQYTVTFFNSLLSTKK